MAVQIVAACPRCQRGWLGVYAVSVPYHERPPFEGEEREDGIGSRPCSGSFGPWAHPTPPATQPE